MLALYAGVAVVAAATIVYEVALTRIFSIAYGYHFAFLAMSLGLLGFGMSGTVISMRPNWRERLDGRALGWLALASSVAFAGGYILANHIPLDPYRVGWDPSQLPLLAAYLAAYALPFLLTGLVQGLPVTAWPERAGRVYAAALGGSGAGGVLALLALNLLSAPQALMAAAIAAAGAAAALSHRLPKAGRRVQAAATAGLVLVLGWVAAVQPTWLDVRMSEYKPLPQLLNFPDARVAMRISSAEARIDVVDTSAVHSAPGLSPGYAGQLPHQSAAVIDGEVILPLTDVEAIDPSFLRAMPSALAYQLLPGARTLVLQPGGGLEIATALNGDAESVVAVEGNAALRRLLSDELAGRTGGIYRDQRVRLVQANPRAYLAGTRERFDVISLALSENRRSVTVGAFSLSETYHLTEEAFTTYLQRLRPGGMVVSHRWLQLPPTEEIRTAAVMAEALRELGHDPRRSMVALRSFSTMLIVAKRGPFDPRELAAVKDFAAGGQFDLVHYPGIVRSETNRVNVLRNDRYFDSFQALLADEESFQRRYEYDVRAPSDDRPFFFHFFKWAQIPTVVGLLGRTWQPFGGSGYLLVLGLLVVTAGLSAGMILIPAAVIRRRERSAAVRIRTLRPALYFAMLGLGFLTVEVALVGRFLLILDHSALAFTMVLFGLLIFSGLGSFLSMRIPWRPALSALAALLLLYAALLSPVTEALLSTGLPIRIAAVTVLLAPLGLLMGVGFPRGLNWLAGLRPSWVPMAWGLNGFMSVMGAVVAALVSLSWGYSVVLASGALAYLIALAAIGRRKPVPSVSLPDERHEDHVGNVL